MGVPARAPSYAVTKGISKIANPRSRETAVGPGLKLGGFLLLLAAIFAGAYAEGAHLGPVVTPQSQSGGGGSMNMGGAGSMNSGGQPAQQARLRGGRP
jgi:hypothetical protein